MNAPKSAPAPCTVDVHVHLAALPDGENGCFISAAMLKGLLFRGLLKKLGLPANDPARANELYIQKLVALLDESRHVKGAVILGMDGVYGPRGDLDRSATHFLVANTYIERVAKRFPGHFFVGASINPQRRDALDELNRTVDAGARLVKILPNSQQFDPARSEYRPFWEALATRQIPLLSHVGYEFSLWGKDQSVGDPAHLRNALDAGVTVIAAHGASFGLFFYEKYWATFQRLVKTYPNFYWDASALSLPNRVGMLLRLRRHPDVHARMLFGTDYPLPCFAYPALLAGKIMAYRALRKISNPFDRHFHLLQSLDFNAFGAIFKSDVFPR